MNEEEISAVIKEGQEEVPEDRKIIIFETSSKGEDTLADIQYRLKSARGQVERLNISIARDEEKEATVLAILNQ